MARMAYARVEDYERVQGSPYYREGNPRAESQSQLDYFNYSRPAGEPGQGSGRAEGAGESNYFHAITGGISPVTERFGLLQLPEEQRSLGLPSSPTDDLQQAIKAVEVAESAIIEQMQENEHLRTELQLTSWELQNYKQEATPSRLPEENSFQASQKAALPPHHERQSLENHGAVPSLNGERLPDNGSHSDSPGTLVFPQSLPPEYSNHVTPAPAGPSTNQRNSASTPPNPYQKGLNQGVISGHAAGDYSVFSQISSPSSRSVSPHRYHREGDFDSRPPLSGQGLIQSPEISNQSNLWKQDLFLRVRAQEEEILQLRKRLADNAIKELKLRNENHVLEKRIAGMRMAFDQQQQDLVDAASKALSYRHDIMEENIRLTYTLQAAEQERSIFVSALLPLLAEYDFQPPGMDAHSIVSNVKVLIQHLHEKLNLSEAKMKDSQYQLVAWRADPGYQSPFAPHSPFHPNLDHSHPAPNAQSLEIVPQPTYAGQIPASPPSRGYNLGSDWDPSTGKYQNVGIGTDMYHGLGQDLVKQPSYSHSANDHSLGTTDPINRTFEQVQAKGPAPVQNDVRSVFPSDRENTVHAPVNGLYSDNDLEDTIASGSLKEKEKHQGDGRSPHLPPLLEEPNSSNSEEDDPLPAIENLQIVGDAVPGNTLQACGFSINGTTLCVFQWVRHLQDGTMCYIEGAAQPDYTVTADDVDALIAIECVPMDDRNQKGELVKVYANEQNKIICDPAMQEKIESYFYLGLATFEVHLSVGSLDIWEPVVLTLKRTSYEIKGNKQRRVVVSEKYTPELSIVIPYGNLVQFVLTTSDGHMFALNTNDDNSMRDTIVLTMRLFKKQALEKKKTRRRVPFFNKS